MTSRPELAEYQALVEARLQRLRQECTRLWLPYVQVGASGGIFGGGPRSEFGKTGGRSDVDVLAVWELKNLGLGNILKQRERETQMRQAEIEGEMIQDEIIAQIVTAAADVGSYRKQIETAQEGLNAATRSYDLNRDRIRGDVGMPLELIQAIRARTDAQNAYSHAVSEYNRAQYRLFHAIGQLPWATGGAGDDCECE